MKGLDGAVRRLTSRERRLDRTPAKRYKMQLGNLRGGFQLEELVYLMPQAMPSRLPATNS